MWSSIISMVHDAGAAAAPIFAFLWWLERKERHDEAKMYEEKAKLRDNAMTEVRLALATLAAILGSKTGNGR